MQHLDTDRLAALADETPTTEEAAHIASCVACRRERDAFVELLALARREGTAGLVPDLAAVAPPLNSWDSLSASLRAEGLIRSPADASAPSTREPAHGGRLRDIAALGPTFWRRAAASVALLVGGAALGRFTAPTVVAVGPAAPRTATAPATQVAAATSAPAPATGDTTTSAAPAPAAPQPSRGLSSSLPVYGEAEAHLASRADEATSFRSVQDALGVLTRAQRDYQRASAWLADHDSSTIGGSPQTLRARLAALDEVLPRFREALHEAPQDPVLNQYYLTAADVRESTLRQLGRALPASMRLNAY
ncbi:hypothetical protein J421_2115 [Gemmatirosa kalamazoonensis]|uniref:Zinc-finger domain-containing protein n=1 Tax=Gemmatirosa kalamazoonensis TaxID=861299 RepID=W0RGV0_9BACT|nr:hypothetical protein [Gemmatirosa kalamazoonensis]AHG89652.1 hypothetical protein J421_2115 [Gemmatirosa kalamazoonensis]